VLKESGKTYHVCPTYLGGRDWPYGAYNPRSNVMFVALTNLCIESTARADRGPQPQFVYNTTNVGKFPAGKDKVGRIDAISVETGSTVWSWETRASTFSPLLATGGGLLFSGSLDRYLRAIDADKGTLLWQTRLAAQVQGGAVTYAIDGRQYIAVAAGGGGPAPAFVESMTPDADMPSGSNAVYVFALP
jgi:alcohol dehydrogenase (cytochrome c)